MLQYELISFLTDPDTNNADIQAIPVLPVKPRPEEAKTEKQDDDSEIEISSPFTFTPQRTRLKKEHELFEDGDIQRHLYLQDVATSIAEVAEKPKVSEFRCHIAGCRQLFDTLEGYEHHYNSLHRHVCSYCKRYFPSGHLLDIHILEWHDSLFQVMAEKQNMYQCLVEGCGVKFKTSNERKDHLIKNHSYPPDFRFDKSKKSKSKAQEKTDVSMEVSEEVALPASDPGSVESMEFCPSRNPDLAGQEPMNADRGHGEQAKPRYSYKVPPSICFGQGSVRGFRGRRKK